MHFIKQGKTADEIRYEDAKKAATDQARKQRILQYQQRQVVTNFKDLGIILPEHMR